jgi:hypothetical protein
MQPLYIFDEPGAPSPAEFMSRAPRPFAGNTPWAEQYALDLRRVVVDHAAHSPRSLQKELGPSEIGTPCDRQVVGKLAGIERTNHIVDPWASIVGTALHAWFAKAFDWDNERLGYLRWLTEFRVHPHPDHPGTGDLYDFNHRAVVDHKNFGDTSMNHLRKVGMPIRYYIQLLLYALGFRNMGLPVDRVVLVAWPRTKSSLDTTYVHETVLLPEHDDIIKATFERMKTRKALAELVSAGILTLNDIVPTPSDEECYLCPFYRADVLTDPHARGCAGHHLIEGRLSPGSTAR